MMGYDRHGDVVMYISIFYRIL